MAIPSSKFCVFLLFVCVYTSVARPNNFGSVGKQDENENGPDVAAELMDQVNPNADSVRTLFKRSKDKDDEDSTLLDEGTEIKHKLMNRLGRTGEWPAHVLLLG